MSTSTMNSSTRQARRVLSFSLILIGHSAMAIERELQQSPTDPPPPTAEASKMWHGLPRILWVFVFLAVGVVCLLLFGRRKLPDFSDEADPLLMNAGRSEDEQEPPMEADPSHSFGGEEADTFGEMVATKTSYQSTDETPPRASGGGPAFGRQITNPAGLVARPQYNPTGVLEGVQSMFGRKKRTPATPAIPAVIGGEETTAADSSGEFHADEEAGGESSQQPHGGGGRRGRASRMHR